MRNRSAFFTRLLRTNENTSECVTRRTDWNSSFGDVCSSNGIQVCGGVEDGECESVGGDRGVE